METRHLGSADDVARAAAHDAIATLNTAIATHGHAIWVLAGGSTSLLAYQYIVDTALDKVDWSHVSFLLGDERMSLPESPDNNWHAIETALLQHLPNATFIRPLSTLSAEQAAETYQARIAAIERFDLTWLGMGEDGHTLSLFPNHSDFQPNDPRLVAPVHQSPKPPADRISLTLHALERSTRTVILATGSGKVQAFHDAQRIASPLPIAQAARITNALWLTDIPEAA